MHLIAVHNIVLAYEASVGVELRGLSSHPREYQVVELKGVDDVNHRVVLDFQIQQTTVFQFPCDAEVLGDESVWEGLRVAECPHHCVCTVLRLSPYLQVFRDKRFVLSLIFHIVPL